MFLALIIAIVIAEFAVLKKALTRDGAIAAILIGTSILSAGWQAGCILLFFFVSCSIFSKTANKYSSSEKSHARDQVQVLANGFIPAVYAILYLNQKDPVWLIGFLSAMAAATADTWATEIGSLSKGKPFHITSFSRVEKGRSGAISFAGTCASVIAAAIISFLANYLFNLGLNELRIITIAGIAGSFIDTFLGATVQDLKRCPVCNEFTEDKMHCHTKANHFKGLKFMTNDMVNFLSILSASILAMILYKNIG
ncbi:MAG: DUF92 domain-containing protein [Lentisphaeria bacterium]|nr:DUF92 domain-containing protein [Lentisphaeria bacterium]